MVLRAWTCGESPKMPAFIKPERFSELANLLEYFLGVHGVRRFGLRRQLLERQPIEARHDRFGPRSWERSANPRCPQAIPKKYRSNGARDFRGPRFPRALRIRAVP